jgi:hypothetical protein
MLVMLLGNFDSFMHSGDYSTPSYSSYGSYESEDDRQQRGIERFLKAYGDPNLTDEQRSRDAKAILSEWDTATGR